MIGAGFFQLLQKRRNGSAIIFRLTIGNPFRPGNTAADQKIVVLSGYLMDIFGVVERVEAKLPRKVAAHKSGMADDSGFSKRAEF